MKKIKVVVEGIEMSLPAEALKTPTDSAPFISGHGPIASSMVKQFVKAKYPSVVCSVKSESFAGGNSLTVWVSNPDGSSIDLLIYNDIKRFADLFQYGHFDGMDDCYHYDKTSGTTTDKGTPIEAGVKYVHTDNRPMFGTVGDCVRMLKGMMAGEYVWGPVSLETAIVKILGYKVPQSNIDKALVYIK
jgi:hypothetical protein